MNTTVTDPSALLARESQLADLGEMAGPLTHEFNNLLNNLTLHLEVLKQQTSGRVVTDLDALRRQLAQTAACVVQFQRYRRSGTGGEGTADLNEALNQAAQAVASRLTRQANGLPLQVRVVRPGEDAEGPATALFLEAQDGLPPVRGHAADLQRLCRFLLNNAVRAAAVRGGAVWARTLHQGGAVQLAVADDGAAVPREALAHVFEPGRESREGMCCLELAACRSIVRRLQGRIEARQSETNGLLMVVSFAA